jgi:hypothetical protein
VDDILEKIYCELEQVKNELRTATINLMLMINQRKVTLPTKEDAQKFREIENTITKTTDRLNEVMMTFSSCMEDREKKFRDKKVYLVKGQKKKKKER